MTYRLSAKDRARLRKLAEAVADHEWAPDGPVVLDADGDFIADCVDTRVPPEPCNYLAAFIAAADPLTVLALLDEVERLRNALKPFSKLADTWTVQTAANDRALLTVSSGQRMCGISADAFILAHEALS